MTTYTFSYTARIKASGAVTYGIIADYHDGHPHILPEKFFRNLTVLAGGYGAGTRITFEMGMLGLWRAVTAVVTEPEPGRLLHEFYPDTGVLTIFHVESASAGTCEITITTHLPLRTGVGGWLERLLVPAYLRRVYRAEIALLEAVAQVRDVSA